MVRKGDRRTAANPLLPPSWFKYRRGGRRRLARPVLPRGRRRPELPPVHQPISAPATCSTECRRRLWRAARTASAISPTTCFGMCCPTCPRMMLCRLACLAPAGAACGGAQPACASSWTRGHTYPVDEGVLLNGLTHAVNLELIAEPEKLIYSWDLERNPIFGNLKTLLLNEWFTTIDLVCILQHSPVLEMLTLQLGNTEKLIGTTGAQETVKESFVCAHLKVVNIECGKVDEGIREILKILSTCGVRRKQISINDPCSRSDCFSFQKRPVATAASTTDGA